jgi:uncharacterized caspase-like protein
MGARDLDENLLRQTFRDFVERVRKAGPDTVAAVYFAGYGLQLDGENYLVPTDADIAQASDVPLRALRLSEQTQALAALHLKTTFMIFDVARASPFVLSGQPPASGLAWVEPETNMLIAFNAAPGTVSPDYGNSYGPYAKALAEMIREGSLTPANVFERVRLRVNELTKGAQVPWNTSKPETHFMFFERGAGAPPRADSPEHTASMRSQPMRSLGAQDAYMVALMRDTFDAYADFLADYWQDTMTKRIRALLAARREAITWRRTYQANLPEAYWSYFERYPRGPHVADSRRLLARLGATIAPPSKFKMMDYEVPPPLPDELEFIERTVLVLDDPAFGFEQPQPSPVYFLRPQPPEFLALVPPAAPTGAHTLPAPMFASLPAYIGVPADVKAPPNPSIFYTRETLVTNSTNDVPKPDGQVVSSSYSPPFTAGSANSKLADSPGLQPSVASKATLLNSQSLPPPVVNPVASEDIKAPLIPLSATVSVMPFWLTDNKTPEAPSIEPPALATGNELLIPVATALAPLPTGMPPRTLGAATLPSWATASIPVSQPVTPSPTGMPSPPSRAAMLSPQTTYSIPLPNPRPATFAPLLTRTRSKPNTNAASVSSPIEVDRGAMVISPPKPQRKPCPILDGRRVCS